MVLAIYAFKVKILTLGFPPPKKTKKKLNQTHAYQTNKHTTNPTPKIPKLQA